MGRRVHAGVIMVHGDGHCRGKGWVTNVWWRRWRRRRRRRNEGRLGRSPPQVQGMKRRGVWEGVGVRECGEKGSWDKTMEARCSVTAQPFLPPLPVPSPTLHCPSCLPYCLLSMPFITPAPLYTFTLEKKSITVCLSTYFLTPFTFMHACLPAPLTTQPISNPLCTSSHLYHCICY